MGNSFPFFVYNSGIMEQKKYLSSLAHKTRFIQAYFVFVCRHKQVRIKLVVGGDGGNFEDSAIKLKKYIFLLESEKNSFPKNIFFIFEVN